MRVCQHCGKSVREFDRFCIHCGLLLADGTDRSAQATGPAVAATSQHDEPVRYTRAPTTVRGLLRLEPDSAQGEVKEYRLDGSNVTIGRAPACTIPLPDDHLASRLHAMVHYARDHYVVADLGSSNGTLVNGAVIHAATPLADGDRITVGQHSLLVSLVTSRVADTVPMRAWDPSWSPAAESAADVALAASAEAAWPPAWPPQAAATATETGEPSEDSASFVVVPADTPDTTAAPAVLSSDAAIAGAVIEPARPVAESVAEAVFVPVDARPAEEPPAVPVAVDEVPEAPSDVPEMLPLPTIIALGPAQSAEPVWAEDAVRAPEEAPAAEAAETLPRQSWVLLDTEGVPIEAPAVEPIPLPLFTAATEPSAPTPAETAAEPSPVVAAMVEPATDLPAQEEPAGTPLAGWTESAPAVALPPRERLAALAEEVSLMLAAAREPGAAVPASLGDLVRLAEDAALDPTDTQTIAALAGRSTEVADALKTQHLLVNALERIRNGLEELARREGW